MQDTINITYAGDKADTIWYIRLGAFLDFIGKDLMYHFEIKGKKPEAALKFDTEVETNLMYIEEYQVSVDPTVCVVKRDINIYNNLLQFASKGEPFESPLFTDKPNPYGQIMNIYVSMKFILLKLNELKDANNNKVVLIDFLNNILSAINSSLGGTSKLEATIFNESTVVIRDGNPLPNIKKVIEVMKNKDLSKSKFDIYDKYARFDLFGYSTTNPLNSTVDYEGKGHASFIKDFNFTTEISPSLSTTITVGATANSTVVGENSTAFSKFNDGLEDRYKEKVTYDKEETVKNVSPYVDPYINSDAEKKEKEKKEEFELYKKYISTFNSYYDYIKKLSGTNPTYNGEAETYKDTLTNFITYKQQVIFAIRQRIFPKSKIFSPSTGFIPFNMSLTMDGLSGMRIYSKFLIDTAYLPANYPDNVSFLIKSINHNISNNKWTTKLESVVISQGGDVDKTPNPTPSSPSSTTDQNVKSNSGGSVEGEFNVSPTYANKTKKLIIDNFGWPITLTGTNPYTSKVIATDPRNVYPKNPEYIKNNIVPFSHKGLNFNLHKALVEPLKSVLNTIDSKGLLPYAKNIQATIYTRDTTGSPGSLSGHSFGIAMDVNPDKFPYGNEGYAVYTKAINDPSHPSHKYAQVNKIIADSGLFNWGGNYSGTKDAHHFSVKPYNI